MRSKGRAAFWITLVCVAGFAAQCFLTSALWNRLSFEDIAESIRNPYWVSQSEIYDGISSNVVYYKALDVYYRICGFHLFAAKEFRLLLSMFSICAVGIVIYFSRRFGIAAGVAFLAWVMSPTLLLFGTSQASFGIDLHIFPIIGLVWLSSLQARGSLSLILLFLAVFMTVLLGGAFPPGLFYLPALILVDLFVRLISAKNLREGFNLFLTRATAMAAGLVSGLLVPFLLIENSRLLLYDPNTGAGLFRGGGKLSLNPVAFLGTVRQSALDLFQKGDSYEFFLPHPEFGTILGILVVLMMLFLLITVGTSFCQSGRQKIQEVLHHPNFQIALFAGILLATFFLMAHISPNLPGLRRSAGMLVAFYLFYYLVIESCLKRPPFTNAILNRILLLSLLMLPANHVIQNFRNLQVLPQYNKAGYPKWLKSHASASESLSSLYKEVKDGRPLRCADVPVGCRYSAPFAALKLYHRTQHPDDDDLQVYAEDPNTGTEILVDISLWRDYYWIH